jgi:hypothetical protein
MRKIATPLTYNKTQRKQSNIKYKLEKPVHLPVLLRQNDSSAKTFDMASELCSGVNLIVKRCEREKKSPSNNNNDNNNHNTNNNHNNKHVSQIQSLLLPEYAVVEAQHGGRGEAALAVHRTRGVLNLGIRLANRTIQLKRFDSNNSTQTIQQTAE